MPLAVGLWNQTRYQKELTVLIPNRAKQHVPCFRLPSATYPKSAFATKSSILIAFNLIQISAAWLVLIAHCRSETLFRVISGVIFLSHLSANIVIQGTSRLMVLACRIIARKYGSSLAS
ncbi:hypothetical protein CPB85DRAFT_1342711 [Mucidula mucida]|nr:hypothetical protein CPB85DRAFT_1342711 [Mucidula mucida]